MPSTYIQDNVAQMAQDLAAGQSRRKVCPVCAADHENSFVVTRDAYQPWTIWFRCYRAKCGVKGHVRQSEGVNSLALQVDDTTRSTGTVSPDAFHPVPDVLMSSLAEQYDIPLMTLRLQHLRYDPLDDAIVLPLYNFGAGEQYRQVGWQHRQLQRKRILNLWRPDVQAMSLGLVKHLQGPSPTVVLVENLFSAYKVQSHCPRIAAVALLGHTISGRMAACLSEHYTRAILLLDADTWPNGTVAALKALAPFNIAAEAIFVDTKPKDMPRAQLVEVLESKM